MTTTAQEILEAIATVVNDAFETKLEAALAADAERDEAEIAKIRADALVAAEAKIQEALTADEAADAAAVAEKDATISGLRGDVASAQQTIAARDALVKSLEGEVADRDLTIAAQRDRIADLEDHIENGNSLTIPRITVGDVAATEKVGKVRFAVTMETAYDKPVLVDFATVAGTAVAGSDFLATAGTVTFLPGEAAKDVEVTIIDDTVVESTESFSLKLSNARVLVPIVKDTGVATIADDDVIVIPPDPPPAGDFSPWPIPTGLPQSEFAAYLAKVLVWFKTNTGPQIALTDSSIRSITTNGAVHRGKRFQGTLRIQANDVVLEDCEVNGGDYQGIDAEGSNRLTVRRVRVIGAKTAIFNNAILSGANALIEYCDVSVHQHAITPQGGPNTIVRYNYVHDGYYYAPTDKHVGGISIKGGSNFTAMLVEGNYVLGQDTSSIFIKNDFGQCRNVTLKSNFMLRQPGAGSYGYAAYSTSDGPTGPNMVSGTVVDGNVWQAGYVSYMSIYRNGDPQPVLRNNLNEKGQPANNP